MTLNDPEQQSRRTFDSATFKNMNNTSQKQLSKKTKFSKLGRHHQQFRSPCLLTLVALVLIFGTVSLSSFQIPTVSGFSQKILNTISNEFESLSLHKPCATLKEPGQNKKYYDDEEVFETLRQSNLKAGKLPIEMMKRATSNSTNPIEELQTAPLNTPTSMTSTTLIPSKTTDSTTSSTPPSISSPTSQVTSLSSGSSSRSLSTVITTVISTLMTEKSSLSLSETSSELQESTSLTEITSGNDLSTSTPDSTSLSTTTRARQTIYTTTLPNGSLSTLTSTTIVQTAVEQTNSMSATKTKETAGLQTNVAQKIQHVPFGQLIGIIAIFIANAP
ncbi:hypothetical protein EPUL_004946 [Erysiphe pulchra]|uniref:Uncharacterized protein n=1 Tax=Erysiphe pulchra TaxID=225359 RepID=A0A2S4PMG9_9PEZI|nr:hypothetical protein EPUL_004946 [Erysiphe pulchra]